MARVKCKYRPQTTNSIIFYNFPNTDKDDKAIKKGNKENFEVLAEARDKDDAGVNDKTDCAANGTIDSSLLIQQTNERVTITHSTEHSEL